jgi:hypothetical protein
MQAFVQKVVLTLFLDHQGPPIEHYMSKGRVTSASLFDLLKNHLKLPFRSKTSWTAW